MRIQAPPWSWSRFPELNLALNHCSHYENLSKVYSCLAPLQHLTSFFHTTPHFIPLLSTHRHHGGGSLQRALAPATHDCVRFSRDARPAGDSNRNEEHVENQWAALIKNWSAGASCTCSQPIRGQEEAWMSGKYWLKLWLASFHEDKNNYMKRKRTDKCF